MTMVQLLDRAIALLKLVSKKSPKNSAEALLIVEKLTALRNWVYPNLATEDIQKVIRCKNCKNYKKYRRTGDIKSRPFYACSITKQKRDPEFFCKDGEER